MITVHHLNNSRSQRILWLLEELQLPYELKRYDRNPQTMLAPFSLRKIHPLGKSPVITDSDDRLVPQGQTVNIAESGAIIEYILDRYGKEGVLRPQRPTPEWLKFTYWMHYAEGSAMPPLLLSLLFSRLPQQPMPFFMRPLMKGVSQKVMASFVNPQLKLHFDFIEAELTQSDWFAGEEFSAADIQMSFPVEAAEARGVLDSSRPRLKRFLERIRARPAYQRAIEKGGPFQLLN